MAQQQSNNGIWFAVLALFAFFVIATFFSELFQESFGKTTDNTNNTQSAQTQRDPLVTVVPESIRGGMPQVLDTDPTRGPLDAPVTIIEFGDFECEACARMSAVMEEVVAAYPNKVRHVWKDFPIPALHPSAQDAALAARCAQDQGAFWEYHNALFQRQREIASAPWLDIATDLRLDRDDFQACLKGKERLQNVLEGYYIARALSIDAAPSYYINETVISGEKTIEEMKSLIAKELESNNNQ